MIMANTAITGSVIGPTMSAISDAMAKTKESIERTQIELSTNQKVQDYSQLAEQSGLYVGLESFLKKSEAELNNILFVNPDFKILQRTIGSIREHAEKFSTLSDEARNKTLPGFNYQQSANATLNLVTDLFNIKTPGRFLCGGSVSDEKPVRTDLLPNPATYNLNDTDDQVMPSYYKGDNELQRIKLSGQDIYYAFRANELGPQRLIRALHIMATADPNAPNYDQKIDEVARVAKMAVIDIRNIESRLGTADGVIKNASTKLNEGVSDYKTQMTKIIGIDRNEVSIRLVTTTQLQNAQTAVAHQSLKSTERAIERFLGG
jgi:hypothetical protein